MKLVFGTTSKRKVEDLQNTINQMGLDIQVLSMEDIGWDRGEIEENGVTIEENSLIKAQAIFSFCKDHNIEYPIMTDDAGLFVDELNGEPGVYTARYADDELSLNPELPKHQCVVKLLRKLNNKENIFPYKYYIFSIFIKNLNTSKKKVFISPRFSKIYAFYCQLFDITTYLLIQREFNALKTFFREKDELLLEKNKKNNSSYNSFIKEIYDFI